MLEPPADGPGAIEVNGETVVVDHPGAYLLVDHGGYSATGELDLVADDGTTVHGVSFAPGLSAADSR